MLTVQTAAPDRSLRPYIRAYVQREARLGTKELVEPVVARLGVMLEFEFANSYEVLNYGTDLPDDSHCIEVIGPQTWRRARLIIRGHIESLVVMFQPAGFHALFGTPTSPLAETGTEGHSVLGPAVSHLYQHLGNVQTFAQRTQLLNRFFTQRALNSRAADPVYKALQLLTRPGSPTRVEEVASHLGMDRRSLERKSLLYSGVSPKALTRIARFSHALHLRSTTTHTWTNIAHTAGYHDHMHMIRDFRVFAGDAPTSALQEIAPGHLIHFAHTHPPPY